MPMRTVQSILRPYPNSQQNITSLTNTSICPIIHLNIIAKGGRVHSMDAGDSCPDPERNNNITLFKYRC